MVDNESFNRNSFITKEEEKELLEKIKRKDRDAKDKFVMNYYPYVKKIASKFVSYGFEFEDLVHYGIEGLIHAIDKYTDSKETRFITYATVWIYHYIRRSISNDGRLIRVPVYKQEKATSYWTVFRQIEQERGVAPTAEEMANILNISYHDSCILYRVNDRVSSIDISVYGDEVLQLKDFLVGNNNNPEEEIGKKLFKEDVIQLIKQSNLTKKQREVLLLHYGLDSYKEYSFSEIANMLGVTTEAIRTLHSRAIGRIRNSKKLEEYVDYLDDSYYSESYLAFLKAFPFYKKTDDFSDKVYSCYNDFLTDIPSFVKRIVDNYSFKDKIIILFLNGWLDGKIYPYFEVQKVLGVSRRQIKVTWNKYIDDYIKVKRLVK